MTDREIAAVAEIHYPVEVRDFLEAHGQQALMHEDLARALALSAPAPFLPSCGGAVAKASPGRSRRRAAPAAKALRLAVLALGVAAGALILHVGLPKIRAEPTRPAPAPTAVEAPPPVRPPEESLCRRTLRNDAAAWCEGALIGRRWPGPMAEPTSGACGDPLKANSDTVRRALNGLLDDEAIGSYGPSEARERCAAAADLAVP